MIKRTSKRVNIGSVSVQEDGPSNEMFEAIEYNILEASLVEALLHVLESAQ